MAFNFVKLESLNFDLSSANVDGIRKYTTPEGIRYPSVTSVLSYGKDKSAIYEWRKRIGAEEANKITQKSANRGTKLHTICEKYLLNELSPMKIRSLMPDIKDFFSQLKPHIDENIGDVYGLEQSLYSDRLRLAGRTDCIAEWAGKLSIVDYKNSIREKKEEWIQDYFVQCTAYAEMFEDRTGMPINQLVVAIANEEGTPQILVKEKHKYVTDLEKSIGNYWKDVLTTA